MKKRFALLLLLLASLLLAGCKSMSPTECKVADWGRVGHADGTRGESDRRIADYTEDCGKVGVIPNAQLYRYGWDQGIVGEAAVDFIRQFKVDIALIGISGIEADGTLRDFDFREVKVSQTIIAHAREVWVAADSSKFNRPAMVEVAKLSQIDWLFTDATPPDPFPELLVDAQVRYTVASSAALQSNLKVYP